MKFVPRKYRDFQFYKVDFSLEEPSLIMAQEQAKAKEPYTQIKDPGSKKRTKQEVYNAQLLGTLADISCQQLLQRYLDKKSPNLYKVVRYDDVRINEFEKPDQYDIQIVRNANDKVLTQIEVRSSVCYKMPVVAMIYIWHILGWYTTGTKVSEKKKDFYMRPIYHYNRFDTGAEYQLKDAESFLLNRMLDLYIIGGADVDLLVRKGEVLQQDTLLQKGALYQTLPIKQGLKIEDFLKAVYRSL